MKPSKVTRPVESFWFTDANLLEAPQLRENLSVDVLIIGAGITGLLTAYYLVKEGKQVIVVDSADEIGGGETGCTTAHLTWMLDSGYSELEKTFDTEKARLAFESHKSAIELIEDVIREENISCDFKRVDAYAFPAYSEDKEFFEEEIDALSRIGASEALLEPRTPLDFLDASVCLHYPGQAQFHPLKFIRGLIGPIQKNKGRIFLDTHVDSVRDGKVKTGGGYEIKAHQIIVATHSPVKNILFFFKEAAYRSYVIGCKIKKHEMPEGLYYDTADPYHYVRTQPVDAAHDLLMVGGEDHKTGQNDNYEASFARLENWAKANFPMFKKSDYAWSGQIIEPVDGLAYIGPSPYHKNTFIATGYSGNGMTYSMIAARIFCDALLGRENEWADLYNPTRKTVKAAGVFLEENTNVVKEMVSGHLAGGDIEHPQQLQPGEGAIMKKGVGHLAVYRDDEGHIHVSSATCPHLGCVVQWNAAQKTFDCPCHGSRFKGTGEVICGPAIRNLKEVHTEEDALYLPWAK